MLELAKQYAAYYLNAKSKHGVHSPFVYDLMTKVLEDRKVYPEYDRVEKLRLALLSNKLVTEVEDYGAGGEQAKVYEKRVSEIVAKTAKPAKWGKLLYRLAKHYQTGSILEFGTSLGISTAYLAYGALASPSTGSGQANKVQMVTMEGSKNLSELASINLADLELAEHVELKRGSFDHILDETLAGFSSIDLVFLDGNHRKEPTLRYFNQLLPKAHNDTVFVFDDIHWSKGMSDAWEELKEHPDVTVSIDLFYMGIIFIRREQVKEDFVLRF